MINNETGAPRGQSAGLFHLLKFLFFSLQILNYTLPNTTLHASTPYILLPSPFLLISFIPFRALLSLSSLLIYSRLLPVHLSPSFELSPYIFLTTPHLTHLSSHLIHPSSCPALPLSLTFTPSLVSTPHHRSFPLPLSLHSVQPSSQHSSPISPPYSLRRPLLPLFIPRPTPLQHLPTLFTPSSLSPPPSASPPAPAALVINGRAERSVDSAA